MRALLLGATTLALGMMLPSIVVAGEGSRHSLKFLDDLFGGPAAYCAPDPYSERIDTERHDFTQTPKTVGRGVWQVEGGYTYFYKDEDQELENSHTGPETLLRYGVSENIELRTWWSYAWRSITEHDGESEQLTSAEDMRFSVKLNMTDQEDWLPESAMELRMSVPTGGSAWTTERVEFGIDYICGWELSEEYELTASAGFSENALGDFGFLPEEPASDHFMLWHQSVALGRELTENSTVYFEYFGLNSYALADNIYINFLNVGVDYFVNDNFVIDFRLGAGLTKDSDDLFTGIGAGYRF